MPNYTTVFQNRADNRKVDDKEVFNRKTSTAQHPKDVEALWVLKGGLNLNFNEIWSGFKKG